MKITIESTPLEQTAAGAVIVPVFEGRREDRFGAGDLCESGEIAGKPLELTLLHHAPGVAATRVLLAGVGKQEKFNPAELRKAVGAAVRHLKAKSVKRIAFGVAPEYGAPDFVSAAIEGAVLGDFEPDRLKTGNDKKFVDEFVVVGGTGEKAVSRGRILGEAQNFTRSLVNEPGNLLTPLKMAEAARKMAAEY